MSVRAGRRPLRRVPRATGVRLPGVRPALLLVALMLPVGSATLAFANLAADHERARADAHLRSVLRAAGEEYRYVLAETRQRARRLAMRRDVQRALAAQQPSRLAALSRRHRNVRFLATGAALPALPPGTNVTVRVARGEQELGRVVATVALDAALVRRLRRATAADLHDRLLVAPTASPLARLTSEPAEVRYRDRPFRAVALPVAADGGAPRLVAMREGEAVEATAAAVRRRVLVAGAVTLFAVALLAYGLAPLLARNRTAVRHRAQAARVLSQLADGVLEVDGSGVVTFWNPAARSITGLAGDDVVGRRADEAIPDWQRIAERVSVASRPGDVDVGQAIPVDIRGRQLWLSVSAVEAEGSVVYAFRDLTDKHRLEEMRSELVATVSHELRTPLASVYGAALTLKRGDALGDEVRGQLTDMVVEHAERLARVVDEVLLASQISAGRLNVADDAFDLQPLVDEVAREARSRARADQVVVAVPLPRPARAIGDPARVRQVLGNLVDNAVKYSPDGGTIELRAEASDGVVRVAVRDEGLGIPDGEQDLVFEKFYRLDAQMTLGVGGTGLGLYIARQLAQQMGGRLAVSSELGTGSTFTLELRRG